MNVLSLFDGISCGQIALNRAGVIYKNYYAAEVDSNAIAITQQNYWQTQQIGSVYDVNLKHLEPIDLLIGGSPCQSFSRSGDNTGFDGKSGLFWEFVRLLNQAKEINPKVYFLLENVMMKKEWRDIITAELGVEPIMIDSTLVSAQKRQRLYWSNIPHISQPHDKNIKLDDIMEPGGEYLDYPELISNINNEWRVKNATKLGYLVPQNGDSVNLDFPKSKTRRGRVGKQKSNTLNTGCNIGFFKDGKIKRFTAIECERLQTVPDNYTYGINESKRRHALGNGWTVDVIAHIFKGLI
jgi:site-specific DNA-cytosine methylase